MAAGTVPIKEHDWKALFELRDKFSSMYLKTTPSVRRWIQPMMGFKDPRTFPVSTTIHNLVGIGIGYKETEGVITPTLSLVVYVQRKLPQAHIAPEELIPAKFSELPTDVVESGRFYAAPKLASIVTTNGALKRRPVQPGCSVGFQYKKVVMAGTLGAIVMSRQSKAKMMLSNNHVLCFESRLKGGASIFQPALLDGADLAVDKIGTLSAWTDLDKDNLDAAVAVLDSGIAYKPDILGFGRLTDPTPLSEPQALLGKEVAKSGRTTDLRVGRFKGFLNAYVDYAYSTRWFQHLVLIDDEKEQFSDAGDSGALVFSAEQKRPVGLLIARGDRGTLAHPLGPVLDKLDVDLEI